ncbi:hypothetical protein TW599 [Tropheryma whipplei TW08/27]|nr:hypothetical protein TW599 [Tropheryma whipplei TW08/27]
MASSRLDSNSYGTTPKEIKERSTERNKRTTKEYL